MFVPLCIAQSCEATIFSVDPFPTGLTDLMHDWVRENAKPVLHEVSRTR